MDVCIGAWINGRSIPSETCLHLFVEVVVMKTFPHASPKEATALARPGQQLPGEGQALHHDLFFVRVIPGTERATAHLGVPRLVHELRPEPAAADGGCGRRGGGA
jgi:hypothetical protein